MRNKNEFIKLMHNVKVLCDLILNSNEVDPKSNLASVAFLVAHNDLVLNPSLSDDFLSYNFPNTPRLNGLVAKKINMKRQYVDLEYVKKLALDLAVSSKKLESAKQTIWACANESKTAKEWVKNNSTSF